MRFARRREPSRAERLREWVWPRGGWWRTFLYVLRMVWRLADSPHAIALGFACGAAISFTPLWGLHFIIAVLLAWLLRGNIFAGLFGTIVGNPITFPFIIPAIYEIGRLILGGHGAPQRFHLWDSVLAGQFGVIWPTWKTMMVGGLVLGPVAGIFFYGLVRMAVEAYQSRRRARLSARQSELAAPDGAEEQA